MYQNEPTEHIRYLPIRQLELEGNMFSVKHVDVRVKLICDIAKNIH